MLFTWLKGKTEVVKQEASSACTLVSALAWTRGAIYGLLLEQILESKYYEVSIAEVNVQNLCMS